MVLEEGSMRELGEEDAEFIGLCDEGQLFVVVVRVTQVPVLTGIFVCEVFFLSNPVSWQACTIQLL